MRKLRLKEVQEAQGHTVSKWQDCNWKVLPSGCKAPVSCLDHTDCGYYVKTLTIYLISITYLILTATPGVGTLMNPTSQRRNWRLWDLPEDIRSVRGRAWIPACAHQHCTGSPQKGEVSEDTDKPGRGGGLATVLEEMRNQQKNPSCQSCVPWGSVDRLQLPFPTAAFR